MQTFQESFRDQRETLKAAASALKAAGVPFALAGGYAVWARGGPESTHDVDFVVPPEAGDAALQALTAAGHEQIEATEDWLDKVRRDGVLVDVIHRLPIGVVDEAMLARADDTSVDSVVMPVMSATDLLLSRVLVLTDHSCDLAGPLAWARALREQIDWGQVADAVGEDPFGQAFLHLLTGLSIIEGDTDAV